MTMKFHKIEMKGQFKPEQVSSNPTWTSADEGKLIYNTTDHKMYVGGSSDWEDIASSSGSTTGTYVGKNISKGDTYWDDCSNISLWTDNDDGTTSSTQATFQGQSTFKLDSVTYTGSAYRYKDVGSTPVNGSISLNVYHDDIGPYNTQGFRFMLELTNAKLIVYIGTDGMYVYDGSSYNLVSSCPILIDEWVTYTFDYNYTTPSSATCDIYVNGDLIAEDIDCSETVGGTDGIIRLLQYGNGSSKITYVSQIRLGTSLVDESFHEWTTDGAGYISGGNTGNRVSTIDKLIFSNDNCDSISSTLTSSKEGCTGFSSINAGYACGGRTDSSTKISTIDKLTFSNDNCNSIISGLSPSRYVCAGFNSSSAGYVCGGGTGTASTDNIDKLTFSNDNTTNITSNLSTARYGLSGFNSSLSGYSCGGYSQTAYVSTIDKLTFSDDSNNIISSHLSSICGYTPAGFNSSLNGYIAGGWDDSTYVSTIDKLSFNNDNMSSITSNLSSARRNLTGFNSTSAGYMCGGNNGSNVSTIDKLTFSNDNCNNITSGLSSTRNLIAGFNTL